MMAQIVDIDVNLVRQILNNEPVEIPLHLLSNRSYSIFQKRRTLSFFSLNVLFFSKNDRFKDKKQPFLKHINSNSSRFRLSDPKSK